MTSLAIAVVALFVGGLVFAALSVVRYSDFLARLHRVSPASVEQLALDTTENWSTKNWRIASYFLRQRYVGADAELNKLGKSVRFASIVSLGLCVLALVVLATKPYG
jgi:hypothetical protein